MWRADFQYNDPVNIWNSLGSLPGSPRLRTITDQQVYTELEYMLLEPSNNTSTWTGTSQFNISVMSQALQRRRDEVIQLTNCNQILIDGHTANAEHHKNRVERPNNRRGARQVHPSDRNPKHSLPRRYSGFRVLRSYTLPTSTGNATDILSFVRTAFIVAG